MPYIQVVTSKKLAKEQKEQIKGELGKVISVIPNKSEAVLMIGFMDGTDLYFGGKNKDNVAFVEVNLHGQADYDSKSILTEKIYDIFGNAVQVAKEDMFISIPEFPNWGFQGKLV